MPKKFQGVNTKAAEAKARKAAIAATNEEIKQKATEDEYWRDDDKHASRKRQRKDAQEQKRLNNLNKKKELEEMYKAEEESLTHVSKQTTSKVTRADIAARKEAQDEKAAGSHAEKLKKKNISILNEEIEENINQVIAGSVDGGMTARTVEEAISALGVDDDLDRHPERRLKASYKKYEQDRMPGLKAANPEMRLSQLRQVLKKEWQKSPENPMNQKHISYNSK